MSVIDTLKSIKDFNEVKDNTTVRPLLNVLSFGWNDDHRLGITNDEPKSLVNPIPLDTLEFLKDKRVVAVSAGYRHSLFLVDNGIVLACGMIGNIFQTHLDLPSPKRISPAGVLVKSIHAGKGFSFLLSSNGQAYSFGQGRFGVLGHGSVEELVSKPKLVERLENTQIDKLCLGEWHCIVQCTNGDMFSWGKNDDGQLGLATLSACEPLACRVPWSSGDTVLDFSVGQNHAMAIVEIRRSDGRIDTSCYGWGSNSRGQLCELDVPQRYQPNEVKSITRFINKNRISPSMIFSGGNHCLMVLARTGQVVSWGAGSHGQLGTGTSLDRNYPLFVPELTGIVKISCGHYHVMAIREESEGMLYCWGYNESGQLGLGDADIRLVPTRVLSLQRSIVRQVSAGYSHSLIVVARLTRPACEEPELRSYFQAVKSGGKVARRILDDELRRKGVPADFLRYPDTIIPNQPGMTTEEAKYLGFDDGYEYCLDTKAEGHEWKRKGYETCYIVSQCRLKSVCLACARLCHKGRYTEVIFKRRTATSICDCQTSDYCKCRWTPIRAEFDIIAKQVPGGDGCIGLNEVHALVSSLRRPLPVMDIDIEDAYHVLDYTHTTDPSQEKMKSIRIDPVSLEKWYKERFSG